MRFQEVKPNRPDFSSFRQLLAKRDKRAACLPVVSWQHFIRFAHKNQAWFSGAIAVSPRCDEWEPAQDLVTGIFQIFYIFDILFSKFRLNSWIPPWYTVLILRPCFGGTPSCKNAVMLCWHPRFCAASADSPPDVFGGRFCSAPSSRTAIHSPI